ncbi:hypothetical protein Tco_1547200 [Tanacetum coccineum]
MAALKFVDSHNVVAFLEKPTGSEDFAQIVDFLNASNIRHLKLADENDEAAFTSVDVKHGGTATTVSSLDARQGSGNIHKTPSISHDSLPRGDTLESDEDSMKLILEELMETSAEIIGLKKRVKKLEEDAIKQGRRIEEIDQDKDISLVSPTQVSDQDNVIIEESFRIFSAAGVLAERGLNTASAGVTTASNDITTAGEDLTTAATKVTTAQVTTATITIASRLKGVVIQELVLQRVTVTIPQLQPKDKGKGIMQEPEKPMKRKHQVHADEELARRIQAEEEEEARTAQERVAKQEADSLKLIAEEERFAKE